MSAATKYVVLRRQEATLNGQHGWVEVGTFDATSASNALRQFGGVEGTYIATPARSFKPVQLTVKKVERVELAPAAKVEEIGGPE